MVDVKKIHALLNSPVSAGEIERQTGISKSQITRYRNEPERIKKMSLEYAEILTKYYEEEIMMDYVWELKQLEKESDTRYSVNIYDNKAELLERLSENADDPEEMYTSLKEEFKNFADDVTIYEVDKRTGVSEYFADAQEAWEYL